VRINDFKEFMKDDPSKLAEAVLGEVPDQLVGYMAQRNIKVGDAAEKENMQTEDN